jgi:flagellin-like protein
MKQLNLAENSSHKFGGRCRAVMMKKRAVSPVVATVLLIAVVIIFALIIFLWARGFVEEAVQKKGKPADQACSEISLETVYINEKNELQITNIGNIPIYGFELKKRYTGGIDIQHSDKRLGVGQSTNIDIKPEHDYNEVEILPAILGEAKTSKKIYTCKKKSFIAS